MKLSFLKLYTTKLCNSNCHHCFLGSDNINADDIIKRELTTDKMIIALNKLREYGFNLLSIGGAEPTAKPNFYNLMEGIADLDFQTKIHTNGININKKLAKLFSKSKMFEIRLSLDGSTSEINNKLRGDLAFEKTLIGVDNLLEYSLNITIGTVLTKNNVTDIGNIIDLAKNKNMTALHAYKLVDKGRGINLKHLLLDKNDFIDIHDVFNKKRKLYGAISKISDKKLNCFNGIAFIEMKPDGNLYLYRNSKADFGKGIDFIGNIFDEDIETKLEKISDKLNIPTCRDCSYFGSPFCIEMDNYCIDDIKF